MIKKKFSKGDNVIVNEPNGFHNGTGQVLGDSPSTKKNRGRALGGSLQWRYKIKTRRGNAFIDENYLSVRKKK